MGVIKKILRGVWVGLLKIQTGIMVTSFIVCVTLMLLEVIFRYLLLKQQLYGLEELSSAICMWLYMTAAAYATYEGSHLQAKITHLFLKSERSEARWMFMVSLVTLGLASYMLTWSYSYFIWGLTKGEMLRISRTLTFPSVYSQGALFFGFNLMVLYFIVEVIKRGRAIFQENKSKTH